MATLLEASLIDYQKQYEVNEAEIIKRLKANQPLHDLGRKGAGIKCMIDWLSQEIENKA